MCEGGLPYAHDSQEQNLDLGHDAYLHGDDVDTGLTLETSTTNWSALAALWG